MRGPVFAFILVLIGITSCSTPDRETFLKRKMVGRWKTTSFGKERLFMFTDSTIFEPNPETNFYADRYFISPLDSISFCTANDTITFKLTFSRKGDSMWIFNKNLNSSFARVQ